MKHLFIVRHGNYGGDYRINGDGIHQMELLDKAMKQILNGSSAYLLSSTAPRALDSSEILAVQLELTEFEKVPYIWSGMDAPGNNFSNNLRLDRLGKLMELINERRDRADGLVMVTHLEVTQEFPSHFFQKEFGLDENIKDISKGQAVHLDLENRAYQVLPT